MIDSKPSIQELWDLFWKYEDRAWTSMSGEHRTAAATMAVAIAKIIAAREAKNQG